MKISRRDLLLTTLSVSGAALVYRFGVWRLAFDGREGAWLERVIFDLLQTIAVPDPRAIGEDRLLKKPFYFDQPQDLVDSLFGNLPPREEAEPSELVELFRKDAQRAFETGNTIQVRQWVLAPNEVDLCALVALARLFSLQQKNGEPRGGS